MSDVQREWSRSQERESKRIRLLKGPSHIRDRLIGSRNHQAFAEVIDEAARLSLDPKEAPSDSGLPQKQDPGLSLVDSASDSGKDRPKPNFPRKQEPAQNGRKETDGKSV